MMHPSAPSQTAIDPTKGAFPNQLELKNRDFIILVLSALVLTMILACSAKEIERVYLTNYPHFCDEVGYNFQNIELSIQLKKTPSLVLAAEQCISDDRHPFRTVPLILFAPQLLSKLFGHMATSIPLIFSFTLMLGIFVVQRIKSVLFSVSAMCFLVSIPGFIDTTLGFGAYWLDPPAAMSFGTAALCLMNYGSSFKLSWLALFATFASITALSRYSAGFYLAFYAAPVFLWMLVKSWRIKRTLFSGIIKPLLTVLLISLPGIIFLLSHLQDNVRHYQTFAYGLNYPLKACFEWTCYSMRSYVGPIHLTVIAAFLLGGVILLSIQRQRRHYEEFLVGLWCPIAVTVFLCCVVKSGDGIHPTVYLAPAMLIAAFSSSSMLSNRSRTLLSLAAALFVTAGFVGFTSYRESHFRAMNPPLQQAKRKQADLLLAKCLSELKAKSFTEFDEENYSPAVESFYRTGWYPVAKPYFTVHESYWKPQFPGLSTHDICVRVYEMVSNDSEVVMVEEGDADIARNSLINNATSRSVAQYATEHLCNDLNWKLIRTIEGPHGRLAIYKNQKVR